MKSILETLRPFFDREFFGIQADEIAIAFGLLFLTLVARRVITEILLRRLLAYANRTQISWDEALIEAVRPPLRALILLYGVSAAVAVLVRSLDAEPAQQLVATGLRVSILVVAAWLAYRMVNVFDQALQRRAHDPDDWVDLSLVPLASNAARLLVYVVSGLVIAQNLGYSVGGIIASLGLGGAALALASQDTLSNLFGSFMIIVDKPFVVGDWISGDGFEGVVERIGVRSTRIRTFDKTIENLPNRLLANVKVENMDRRKDAGLNVRRIKMTIGISYATTAAQMDEVLEGIRGLLAEDEGVAQNQTVLVRFTDFGESALEIFLYYFADRADWDYYLSVRERINLKIMRLLESLGLEIAFPSRSVYVESWPPAAD